MINPLPNIPHILELDQDVEVKEYLSDFGARDKLWDIHKIYSQKIASLYESADNLVYADRIKGCANYLKFALKDLDTNDYGLKLAAAHFCHVPQCQLCNWLRSRMWRRRFFKILPQMLADLGDGYQFLFLTLTARNCELDGLRQQLKDMSAAWKRLSERKDFVTFKGFTRTTEITRNYDVYFHDASTLRFIGRMGTRKYYDWFYAFLAAGGDRDLVRVYPTREAHPHYHALLLVEDSYFDKSKSSYWHHSKWMHEWKSALRIDYDPYVHIKAVKSFDAVEEQVSIDDLLDISLDVDFDQQPKKDISSQLIKSVLETLKYCVKPADIVGEIVTHPCSDGFSNYQWLQDFTEQVYRVRKIATGGLFKSYLKDLDKDESDSDLIGDSGEGDLLGVEYLFKWYNQVNKYKLLDVI
jgi:plasmid rolling circle replication initiator protein Rep